jgi:hypothetical protein
MKKTPQVIDAFVEISNMPSELIFEIPTRRELARSVRRHAQIPPMTQKIIKSFFLTHIELPQRLLRAIKLSYHVEAKFSKLNMDAPPPPASGVPVNGTHNPTGLNKLRKKHPQILVRWHVIFQPYGQFEKL